MKFFWIFFKFSVSFAVISPNFVTTRPWISPIVSTNARREVEIKKAMMTNYYFPGCKQQLKVLFQLPLMFVWWEVDQSYCLLSPENIIEFPLEWKPRFVCGEDVYNYWNQSSFAERFTLQWRIFFFLFLPFCQPLFLSILFVST